MRKLINKAICWLRGHEYKCVEGSHPQIHVCSRCHHAYFTITVAQFSEDLRRSIESIEAQYNAPSALFTKNLSE